MKYVPHSVSRKIGRAGLHLSKHSPTILFGVGIVGFVGTVVLASKATLKLDGVIDDAQKNIAKAKYYAGETDLGLEGYTTKDAKHDIALIYGQSAFAIVKLYAPAIIIGGLSIMALTSSHNILSKRNAAITAAYAAVDKGFSEYRKRVVDEFGEEKDYELRYGVEACEIIVDEGKKGHRTEIIKKPLKGSSIYARFFDDLNPNWKSNVEMNRIFLTIKQQYCNDMLRARGHLFLNEVYDELGFERTEAGQSVGWVLGNGDDFIDFGFIEETFASREFVNGYEASVLLDFNVDGPVHNLLKRS